MPSLLPRCLISTLPSFRALFPKFLTFLLRPISALSHDYPPNLATLLPQLTYILSPPCWSTLLPQHHFSAPRLLPTAPHSDYLPHSSFYLAHLFSLNFLLLCCAPATPSLHLSHATATTATDNHRHLPLTLAQLFTTTSAPVSSPLLALFLPICSNYSACLTTFFLLYRSYLWPLSAQICCLTILGLPLAYAIYCAHSC